MTYYSIRQAAEHSGLTPKMIRDYEQKGLLVNIRRNDAGYRLYTEQDLHTLFFIAHARTLGFSLKQIAELVALWQNPTRSSADVKALAQSHIQTLEQKAQQLHEMANSLRQLVRQCHGDEHPDCPILKGLEKPFNSLD
ncbi:MAG: Cu(I)-responsive transcriptional regulator [Alcaligenaceae bacterium]|uniref:Cu(I)-responsive transcriptional regulator n=1 Tax=Paenalcaligenes hermetiae TaxID=1157987 RepID=A0ABP9MBY0_9BURK|nr:Cu(I)-responsive transcriptional regulator [Alcaligenaceae bacterium]